MELSIDEKRVVLSDFDSWGIILNNGLISQSEEEDEQLENKYEQLSDSEKSVINMKIEDVQAVRFFRTGIYKR